MPAWVIFLGVLSVLVLVHELGHFLAARLLGIKVEEFAFGLPFTKPILRMKLGGTEYAIYPLIFGGFVRLYGEDAPPSAKASEGRPRSFWDRGRKQRMVVIAAGVVMNLVLAMAAFWLLYSQVGIPGRLVEKVTIAGVAEGSPAQAAGLAVNDRVVAVEGKEVGAEDFSRLMRSWAGISVNLTIERGPGVALLEGIAEGPKEELVVSLVPRINPPEGQGPTGVVIASYPYLEMARCPMFEISCSIRSVEQGFRSTWIWIGRVLSGLREIGKSIVAGKKPEGVAGPVGIYELTKVVSEGGVWPVVELVAVLSVNLAVFNVLPIPALDGGRMAFIWLEWVRRRRLPASIEQKINSWGMALLLGLLALITLQDVIRIGILGKLGL